MAEVKRHHPQPDTAAHTPGPWRDCDSPSNFQRRKQFIRPANSEALIAIVSGDMKSQERWANSRLIAAAPEMLLALQAVESADPGAFAIVGDAIRKATGK